MKEIIREVVTKFYKNAMNDILIGYHFKSILQNFDEHIETITIFWMQHLDLEQKDNHIKFNLIKSHAPLKATTGQLKRWIMLFNNQIDQAKSNQLISLALARKWKEKISVFEKVFIESDILLR
jgi:truncated hemoglobin YjbI